MSSHRIKLTVNGAPVEGSVSSRTLLVHFLRDHLRLTGTHIGCDTSQCGACTVEVDGCAVKSCTVLAVMADGARVMTIECVADGTVLDPIQEAFRQHHGLQCGYCTPGMVMMTRELLRHNPAPTEHEIREALHGNLCRCTGYHNIVESIKAAADALTTHLAPERSELEVQQ